MSFREVQLSTGMKLQVKELNWAGYKRIKTRVLELLSQDLPKLFDLVKAGDWQGCAALAGAALSQLDEPFIGACVVEAMQQGSLDEMPLSDVVTLLAAVKEVNPVSRFMELEKNSPSGGLLIELTQLLAKQGQVQQQIGAVLGGGSDTNTP